MPATPYVTLSFIFILAVQLNTFAASPIPATTPSRLLSGAVGNGKSKDTAALQSALDQCATSGGGEVVVPPGNYLIGSVELKSNTTLRLTDGATLIGSPDAIDYPLVQVRFEGEFVQGHRALIFADHASNVAILGPGTLQGDMTIGDLRRPRAPVMMEFVNCDHVRLENFKDRYRRMWSIHLLFCQNVLARNLSIRTTRTNGDGIDVDSTTDVQIEHCDIDTGDDCISLKSGRGLEAMKAKQATANISITDCTLGSNFAGVGIGTEMSGGVHDVKIQHCTFTRGDNAIFLKSRLGRGGAIENITGSDLDTSSKTCIGINLVNKGIVGAHPVTGEEGVPLMQHLSFNNIQIHAGTLVDGSNVLPDKPIDDFSLSNVTGACKKGISLANVTRATLSKILVTGYTGPLLETQNVTGIGLEGAVPPGVSGMNQLTESFITPPDDCRAMVRWWWFGPAVTPVELGREIDAMKAGGFGGFEVQPSYPLAVDGPGLTNLKFMSPQFLDCLNFAAGKAKETGMRMDLTLGSGWPYGGPIFPITEAAGKLRVESQQISPGEATIPLPKMRAGEALIGAYTGATSLAVQGNSVQLAPEVVAAKGTVVFFISSHTGMKVKRPAYGAEGYVMDHDNLAVAAKFIDQIGNKEIEACGANPPFSVFCDSLESYGEDWTDNLLAEFQKRRGYDLRPLLPALVGDIGPKTPEIRHDWGQTLTELFNDSFIKPFRSLAEDHKIRFRIQAYGQPSAGLFSYGDADLPEGEGWQWHGYRASRFASSACHLMGVPVSSSETFTWIHNLVFRATPLDIKAEADLHFLQGINQVICHGWPYTPPGAADPGWSFYAAGVFDDKNPWYGVMPDVNRYIQRVSCMMRQGKPANDVLLYLANSDAWAQFTPGHISLTDGVGQCLGREIVGRLLDGGYDLDFFDDQMLERFGRVSNGNFNFGNIRYRTVVLAGVERMPVATLRLLEEFSRGGGLVVATRRLPAIAPGMNATDADQKELKQIVARLFTDPGAMGVFVADESQVAAAISTRLAPDVALSPAAPQIGFVHRQSDFADIYFLANTGNRPVEAAATFRLEGSAAQSWNPVTGEIKPIEKIERVAGGSRIHVSLDAYESTLIVWSRRVNKSTTQPALGSPEAMDLSTNWTVELGKDTVQMPTLVSWADNPATKYFSGTASYGRHFMMPAGGHEIVLSFGPSKPVDTQAGEKAGTGYAAMLEAPVRDAAKIYVNDYLAGSVWCPPYRLNITSFVVPGENNLRVEVANTAVNEIAGTGFPNYDLKAITERFGTRFTPSSFKLFQPLPSGIIGPVQLLYRK